MAETLPAVETRPAKSRYVLALAYFLTFLCAWTVLRVVLFLAFRTPAAPLQIGATVANGLVRDIYFALVETLPLLFWLTLLSNRFIRSLFHRRLLTVIFSFVIFIQIFLLFVEFFFFEEFKSRFNTVAVDYLLYPQEVFVNIWESYHVGVVVLVCLILTLAWICFVARRLLRAEFRPVSARRRWAIFAGAFLVVVLLAPVILFRPVHIADSRTLSELANNGGISFVNAWRTRHLDYAAFYRTLPPDEAYRRTRLLLEAPSSSFVATNNSILRHIEGNTNQPRLNVVILLQESLGSEFWGCLGRTNTLTPRMDELANREGILFTNLYATGNRTVRGMEGVLSSFPPLPGDSIVKRHLSDNVETVARVLKRDGYSTIFIYGGRGLFDGMRSYAIRNGYDRFVEQKDFSHPTFKTGWGVCDEDLMKKSIEELRALNQGGKPFFATLLSVSNHKPYTYPKGRIPEDPRRKKREHAVKYADFALGQFFDAAKKEAFWTNTIFAVIADHGARVYGSQSIPIHSYEIPLVIAGPAAVHAPARWGALGCSMDVAPTLLGLIGRPYDTLFFGRDLLKLPQDEGRAFLNHNRDIGMLAGDRMVVLGLMQSLEFYEGDPKKVNMTLLREPQSADLEVEKNATALFQVADDLYTHQAYRLDAR